MHSVLTHFDKKIKNSNNLKCWWGYGEINILENNWTLVDLTLYWIIKVKILRMYEPEIPFLSTVPKEMRQTENFYCVLVYGSENWKISIKILNFMCTWYMDIWRVWLIVYILPLNFRPCIHFLGLPITKCHQPEGLDTKHILSHRSGD